MSVKKRGRILKEVNIRQADNLRKLLRYEGKSQAEFSRIVHIPEPTISNWLNGKHGISTKNAQKICEAFPESEYDLDFILGNSKYPNGRSEESAMAIKGYRLRQCVEILAASRGFHVEDIGRFDSAEYSKLVKDGYEPINKLRNIEYVERIENGNGEVLELSDEQWSYFVDEIGGYIEMRLGQMFERGAW